MKPHLKVLDNPFFVFPNPATDYIYFYKEHDGSADYQLNIYNSSGGLVRTIKMGIVIIIKLIYQNTELEFTFLEYISNFDLIPLRTKFFVK